MTHEFRGGSPFEADADIENRIDRLVELVVASASDRVAGATCDERFLAWWAAELRAWQRWDKRAAAQERAARFAREVLATVGEGPTIPKARGTPDERPLESPRTAAHLIERHGEGLAPWLEADVAAGEGRDVLEERCERVVVVPPELPKGAYVAMTVRGESMLPLLHPGDVVLAKVGAEAVPGSLVIARRPEHGLVVKRLRKVNGRSLTLQSANRTFAPLELPPDRRLLIGSVVYVWCGHDGRVTRSDC